MVTKPGRQTEGSQGPAGNQLEDLGRRIHAAREAGKPPPPKGAGKFDAASMAWRMTIELCVGAMVGGAMGWGLDSLFGTLPIFLIVFTLLGFAAGIRTMMRSADELRKKQADHTVTKD